MERIGFVEGMGAAKLPIFPFVGEMGGGNVAVRFAILAESTADVPAREALLDRAMGAGRKRKSSEKLRRGRKASEGLAFVAKDAEGCLVGTVRLWDVAVKLLISPLVGEMGGSPEGGAVPPTAHRSASRDREIGEDWRSTLPPSALPSISPTRGEIGSGYVRALLLGPLAVDPSVKSAGIGSALMRHAIAEAKRLGHRAILLVGDPEYYARFGFCAEKTAALAMPGPYERYRLLALELENGTLDGAAGVLRAAGRKLTAGPASLAA